MYRLWRHVYEARRHPGPFWVHGFRTNEKGFVSLDDYNGKINLLKVPVKLFFFCNLAKTVMQKMPTKIKA